VLKLALRLAQLSQNPVTKNWIENGDREGILGGKIMKIMNHKRYVPKENEYTYHSIERNNRLEIVDKLKKKEPHEVIKSFYVDKNHENGCEIHNVLENGVIEIYNAKSEKFITTLIARPAQISRYYEAVNKKAPNNVLNYAKKHVKLKLNEV
jgi:hypothetical protein